METFVTISVFAKGALLGFAVIYSILNAYRTKNIVKNIEKLEFTVSMEKLKVNRLSFILHHLTVVKAIDPEYVQAIVKDFDRTQEEAKEK